MKTTNEERVDLRVPALVKKRLKQVAALTGRSMSDFIVAAAMEKADEVSSSVERWELNEADSRTVFDALMNPNRDISGLRALFEEIAAAEIAAKAPRKLVEA